jgi:predicted O-methyltransferase YrrM
VTSVDEALGAIEGVEGWLSEDQARRLFAAAAGVSAPARIVEIGSYRGRSAIVLRKAAEPGVEVIAIDPHAGSDRGPQQLVGSRAEGDRDHRVFQENLRRAGVLDSVAHVRMTSEKALDELEGEVALLYVDGAHRYTPARHDLVRWGARVAPGGRLLVHDAFSSVGVTLALLRDFALGDRFDYRGRSGSMAEYQHSPTGLDARARALNCLRQLAELPWFARNLLIKVLVVVKLRRAAGWLGLRPGDEWPY